jgi:type II secretory pathway component PulC
MRTTKRTTPSKRATLKVMLAAGSFLLLPLLAGSQEVLSQKQPVRSRPDISLLGVVVVPDGLSSMAIIKANRTAAIKILKAGEKMDGLSLIRISGKGISLQEGKDVYDYVLIVNAPESRRKMEEKAVVPDIPEPQPAVSLFTFDRRTTERSFRSELPVILSQAEFVPNIVDGQMRGYRIVRFPRRGILWETGLAPGDILLSIGGVELNGASSSFSLYQMLKNQEEFFAVVERDKREITLHYVFK